MSTQPEMRLAIWSPLYKECVAVSVVESATNIYSVISSLSTVSVESLREENIYHTDQNF